MIDAHRDTVTAMPIPLWDVCVVVPMFNEATVIESTIADLRQHFPHVICVDDGSSDETASRALSAGATLIRHPFNLGQGAALTTGIRHAIRTPGIRYIVTFDADGQHLASDAARLVQAARDTEAQVVLGSRFLQGAHGVPWHRAVLLRAALWLTRRTSGLSLTDTHNGLRVLCAEAAVGLELKQSGMAHASEILHEIARLKFTIHEEPVSVLYTDYSVAKGQSALNAINILHDLVLARLRFAK